MNSTEIVPFAFEGVQVRALMIDGEPWFVAADVAAVLAYRMASDMTRTLDNDEWGTRPMRTPSGEQKISMVNEAGLFKLMVQRQTGRMTDAISAEKVKAFQRWVTHDVLPSINKSGSYSVEQVTRAQLAQMVLDQEAEIEAANARAEHAEATVDFIEGSAGLSVREFHKQYFSDTPEKEFNEFLYSKHLLIDQRGTRGRDSQGRLKNGKEHRHPTFRGKAFFFLDPTVDRVTGDRYYQTKVRPGEPEVLLVEYLTDRGLHANRNVPRALEVVR